MNTKKITIKNKYLYIGNIEIEMKDGMTGKNIYVTDTTIYVDGFELNEYLEWNRTLKAWYYNKFKSRM